MAEDRSSQQTDGSHAVQAHQGGVAVVNKGGVVSVGGRAISPLEISAEEVTHGEERLSELPLDTLPPVSVLPPGSRMPLSRNPVFVGREEDLKMLAAELKTAR